MHRHHHHYHHHRITVTQSCTLKWSSSRAISVVSIVNTSEIVVKNAPLRPAQKKYLKTSLTRLIVPFYFYQAGISCTNEQGEQRKRKVQL